MAQDPAAAAPEQTADAPTPQQALAAQQAALQTEYGTYVCGPQPISIYGVRAFNPGAPVPVSHVDRFDLIDQVVKVAAAAAAEPDAAPDPTAAAPAVNLERKDA